MSQIACLGPSPFALRLSCTSRKTFPGRTSLCVTISTTLAARYDPGSYVMHLREEKSRRVHMKGVLVACLGLSLSTGRPTAPADKVPLVGYFCV